MSRPEPISPPALTPGAPATGEASTLTPQPGVPEAQPEAAATPVIPNPTQQEPISDSLNTDDIPSLHQWATEGLWDTVTPTTGSRGPMASVVRITAGSVTWSQWRRTGSIQTNLFGGTREDPATRFCRWMKEQMVEEEEQMEEIVSSKEEEEDPVDNSGKEEEDPGSSDGYGSDEEEEDEDSPPALAHRLVTKSTPKKLISRPKQKAYKTKGSGPGGSSQKQSKGQR